jgi:hypothetical protein
MLVMAWKRRASSWRAACAGIGGASDQSKGSAFRTDIEALLPDLERRAVDGTFLIVEITELLELVLR